MAKNLTIKLHCVGPKKVTGTKSVILNKIEKVISKVDKGKEITVHIVASTVS